MRAQERKFLSHKKTIMRRIDEQMRIRKEWNILKWMVNQQTLKEKEKTKNYRIYHIHLDNNNPEYKWSYLSN
jgi:hypothetical protein